MSKKFRLDCKISFQNTFYTKCINVKIDSIGPSIILRSIDRCRTKTSSMGYLHLRVNYASSDETVLTGRILVRVTNAVKSPMLSLNLGSILQRLNSRKS